MYPKQVEDYSTLISDHFRPWVVEQGADPDKFMGIVEPPAPPMKICNS